jgi:ABC-type Fe3+ transport system permease subunit
MVTSKNGFTGTVNFSCGSMPEKMTCGFGSAFLIGQPKPISTTVTVTTVATSLATLSGLLLIGFGTRKRIARFTRRSVMLGCILSTVVVAMAGCGVNQYEQTDGTPKGTYTVQVIGTAGSLVHTQAVIITVN